MKLGNLEFYFIKELSKVLEVTPESLRGYIKDGRLKGQKVGGKWIVTKPNLEAFLSGTKS